MEKSGTRRLSLKQRLEGAIKMVERKETGKFVQEISNETNIPQNIFISLKPSTKLVNHWKMNQGQAGVKKSLLRLRAGLLEVSCLNLFKAQNKSSQK